MNLRRAFKITLLGITALAASPVFAQPSESGTSVFSKAANGLEEVVVTARRRSESVQSVPLAVSAIPAVRLEKTHAVSIADLVNLSPSVNFIRNATNPSSLFPFIRGFGSKSSDPSAEPPVAFTLDGIYQAYVIGLFVNLFDVEGVEVEKGPQGTLLGKNAPAGGVSVTTRRPKDEFGGMAQVDYGSYNDLELRGYVDVPIVPGKLDSTISYFRQTSDGYVYDTRLGKNIGGLDTQSARVGLLFRPTEQVTWYVTSQYDLDRGEQYPNRNISDLSFLTIPTVTYPAASPAKISSTCSSPFSAALCRNGTLPVTQHYTTLSDSLPNRDSSAFSITSDLKVDAGPVSITSVSGYRKFHENNYVDISGAGARIFNSHFLGNYTQASEEVRMASRDGGGLDMNGKLNWLAGAYYFHNSHSRLNDSVIFGADSPNYQAMQNDSYAVFAHAEYKLTKELSLSAGGRESWDSKTKQSIGTGTTIPNTFFGQPPSGYQANQAASFSNFSAEATLSYKVSGDMLTYFRFAQGYRGGGFNGVPGTAALVTIFSPEIVNSYELGAKMDFLDHRARLNVSAFHNDFSNLQRTITQPILVAPFFVQLPQNIASAVTQGIDIESQLRPFPELTLRGNVGYLDAHYTSFLANVTGVGIIGVTDNKSLKFTYASKLTALIGATYDKSLGSMGSVTFNTDYAYRSALNVTDLNFSQFRQKAYGLLSADISWDDPSGKYRVSVYGKNLLNTYYFDGGDAIGGVSSYVTDGAPQTIGASVRIRF